MGTLEKRVATLERVQVRFRRSRIVWHSAWTAMSAAERQALVDKTAELILVKWAERPTPFPGRLTAPCQDPGPQP